MKVLFLTEALTLFLIPREYPADGDTLSLSLRNEFTDEVITPAVTFETLSKQLLVTLTTQPTDFKIQNKYEATLSNGATVIYYGKIIVLEAGTDVQNYQYNSQTNVRFDY
jgi:hypothetical protein